MPVVLVNSSSLRPTDDSIVAFIVEDIRSGEADLRLTFYRKIHLIDGIRIPVGGNKGKVYEVHCSKRLISKYPRYKKRKERYFSETLFDSFEIGIYDTANKSDILKLVNYPAENFKLSETPRGRLFRKYIKPDMETKVFCKFEVRELGAKNFRVRTIGELQNGILGEDARWYIPKGHDPYLDEFANKEKDAERFWNLRFSNVGLTGLGETPVKPVTDPADTSSYYMPFYNPGNPSSALPYGTLGGKSVVQLAVGMAVGADGASSPIWGRWRRHIPAHVWVKSMLDYAYGVDQYIFRCETSPIELEGAIINNDDSIPSGQWKSINISFEAPPEEWILLPQALFGLHEDLAVQFQGIPYAQNSWPRVFKSGWEGIQEFCLMFGWVPKVSYDRTINKHIVVFKARNTYEPDRFLTIKPTGRPKPEIFPESEAGIRVELRRTFMNANTKQSWFDDWYAVHIPGTTHQNSTALRPQANGFTIPSTAADPATLATTMCFGGTQWHKDGGSFVVHYYGVGKWGTDRHSDNRINMGEDYPMLTPLVSAGPHGDSQINGATEIGFNFRPVVRGRFRYAPQAAAEMFIVCNSWRQLLARFYSIDFVRSDYKYTIEYPTATQFTNNTKTSSERGQRNWDYKDVDFVTNILGDEYYVQAFDEDWNKSYTIVEYLGILRQNHIFNGTEWFEGDQITGDTPGDPPNDPPRTTKTA